MRSEQNQGLAGYEYTVVKIYEFLRHKNLRAKRLSPNWSRSTDDKSASEGRTYKKMYTG
jgi:hypothetical protein